MMTFVNFINNVLKVKMGIYMAMPRAEQLKIKEKYISYAESLGYAVK